MALITPFKPFKHTLLVNTLNVKGHFVFFKKKKKCGGRNTYGLYRLNRILTNYHSNITEFLNKENQGIMWGGRGRH